MGGPPSVPPIEYPPWYHALCVSLRRAAAGMLGAGAPVPPPPPPPFPGFPPGNVNNPLSLEQAEALFGQFRDDPRIPFNYPQEYCYARAHEMARLMREQGIECRKLFVMASVDENRDVNDIRVVHPVEGDIQWQGHVAPTVSVQTPEGVVRMALDPALFDGPVPVEEWLARMECRDPDVLERPAEVYYPGNPEQDWDGEVFDDDNSLTERRLAHGRILFDHRERVRTGEENWADGLAPGPGSAEEEAVA